MKRLVLYITLAALCTLSLPACKNDAPGSKKSGADTTATKSGDAELGELNRAIGERSSNPELYIKRARAYERLNQLEPAIRDVGTALELDSMQATYYHYLGQLYLKRPNETNAMHALEKAVLRDPNYTDAWVELGKLYFYGARANDKAGKPTPKVNLKYREKSIRALNTALKQDPDRAEAYFWKGMNYREDNNFTQAVTNLTRAVELKPDMFEAYEILGILYAAKNDRKAEQYYTSALQLRPGNITTLYNRGLYYQSVDSLDKAATDYQAILDQQPENRDAAVGMGYVLFSKGSFEKAAEYYTRAINADPNYAPAYEGRATAYTKMGKAELAKEDRRTQARLEGGR